MLYPLRGKAYIDSGGGGKLILGRLPHTKLYEFWFPAVLALKGGWMNRWSNDRDRSKDSSKYCRSPFQYHISLSPSPPPLPEGPFFTLDLRESRFGVGGFLSDIHKWHDEYFHLPIPMPSTPYLFY